MEYNKEEKKEEGHEDIQIKTIFSVSDYNIKSTGITMCKNHYFVKHGDTELVCTICPTVMIVKDQNQFLNK